MGVLPRAGQDDRRAGMMWALLAGADDRRGRAGLEQGQQRPAVAGRAQVALGQDRRLPDGAGLPATAGAGGRREAPGGGARRDPVGAGCSKGHTHCGFF